MQLRKIVPTIYEIKSRELYARCFLMTNRLYNVLYLRLAAFFACAFKDELVGHQGDEFTIGGLLSLVLLRSNRLIVYVFATCRI